MGILPRGSLVVSLVCAAPVLAGGGFDIPTGAPPSPLFGAEPFTQKMPLFEEFGLNPVPQTGCVGCKQLPVPATCEGATDGTALDAFLAQPLFPAPTRQANIAVANQAVRTRATPARMAKRTSAS